jgi:hypothetical protein
MADTSQGEGWWQASDGKWYAPQAAGMPGPPPDAKKKGGCLKWGAIGLGAIVVLVILAAVLGGGGDSTDDATNVESNAPGTTATESTDAAPAATAAPKSSGKCGADYPDKQKNDQCPGQSIDISGYTTTISGMTKVSKDAFGDPLLCVDVSITNRDKASQPYNEYNFSLQTPGGDVQDPTMHTQEPKLGSGTLVNGGSKAGKVCFENPGETGKYIVIWKPDAFNDDRGLWFYNG